MLGSIAQAVEHDVLVSGRGREVPFEVLGADRDLLPREALLVRLRQLLQGLEILGEPAGVRGLQCAVGPQLDGNVVLAVLVRAHGRAPWVERRWNCPTLLAQGLVLAGVEVVDLHGGEGIFDAARVQRP